MHHAAERKVARRLARLARPLVNTDRGLSPHVPCLTSAGASVLGLAAAGTLIIEKPPALPPAPTPPSGDAPADAEPRARGLAAIGDNGDPPGLKRGETGVELQANRGVP